MSAIDAFVRICRRVGFALWLGHPSRSPTTLGLTWMQTIFDRPGPSLVNLCSASGGMMATSPGPVVVAERIARGQPVYHELSRGPVRRALEALRDAGIIESRGRAQWRIYNPLFRRDIQTIEPLA